MKKVLYLFISIILLKNVFSQQNNYSVSGNIIFKKGDFLSQEKLKSDRLTTFTVIAVRGKVRKPINSKKVNLIELRNNKKNTIFITRTNQNSQFKFNLKSGIYTFFILKGDSIYSNIFDGEGYYKSHRIIQNTNGVSIIEDSEMIY